jgi:hypothetical protein
MKRTLLLSSILMLSAVWALAQYEAQPSTASQSSSDASKTTIQGCLAGSDGNYTLTDQSGTAYQLSGNTTKLQNHVGHTIQVTGTSASGAGMTGKHSGSMSAPADAQPVFTVTSFKHVATSCKATQ